MSELREFYLASLPPQIDALEAAIDAFENGDISARDTIGRVAHQLKGSGASYGFPEVTDRALEVLTADDMSIVSETQSLVSLLAEMSAASTRRVEKILVVDDDPAIQMLVQHSLEGPDREILAASTMSEGWEALEENPDLLVLDLILPDADGRELLGKLRSDTQTADLTVVVLSGSDSEVARAECLALGANAFLHKPFDSSAFSVLVESLLRTDELANQRELVAVPPVEAEAPSPAPPRSVLLAEDDDLVAALIVDRLGRDGFTMVRCSDGETALAEARKNPPDVAILDVKMPKMDGFEVLLHFSETPELADTAIIVLTAMGSEHDVVRGFDLGADDYILKPFSPTELAARVQRLAQR